MGAAVAVMKATMAGNFITPCGGKEHRKPIGQAGRLSRWACCGGGGVDSAMGATRAGRATKQTSPLWGGRGRHCQKGDQGNQLEPQPLAWAMSAHTHTHTHTFLFCGHLPRARHTHTCTAAAGLRMSEGE